MNKVAPTMKAATSTYYKTSYDLVTESIKTGRVNKS